MIADVMIEDLLNLPILDLHKQPTPTVPFLETTTWVHLNQPIPDLLKPLMRIVPFLESMIEALLNQPIPDFPKPLMRIVPTISATDGVHHQCKIQDLRRQQPMPNANATNTRTVAIIIMVALDGMTIAVHHLCKIRDLPQPQTVTAVTIIAEGEVVALAEMILVDHLQFKIRDLQLLLRRMRIMYQKSVAENKHAVVVMNVMAEDLEEEMIAGVAGIAMTTTEEVVVATMTEEEVATMTDTTTEITKSKMPLLHAKAMWRISSSPRHHLSWTICLCRLLPRLLSMPRICLCHP